MFQVAEDLLAEFGEFAATAGPIRPGEEPLQRPALKADPGAVRELLQTGPPGLADRLGSRQVLGDQQRDVMKEEIVKAFLVSREFFMQKIADLTAQRRGLLDQVTSMLRPGAELRVVLGQDRFDQAEAVDRAAMDGREIGVIGLPVGVCRLAKLLGRERMDDADLEARGRDVRVWPGDGISRCAR